MNRTAIVVTGIYLLITSGIAIRTALDSSPGLGSVKHIYTFFATAPISVPLSILGLEPNFNRPFIAFLVILAATALVYTLSVLIDWTFDWIAVKL